MYNSIYNPNNNNFINIFSKKGKYLLKRYIIQSGGAELRREDTYKDFNYKTILSKHNSTINKDYQHLYALLKNNFNKPIYASLHGSDLGYGVGMDEVYKTIGDLHKSYIKVPDNLFIFHSYKLNCAAQTSSDDEFALKQIFTNPNWPLYSLNKCNTSAGSNSHLYFPKEYIYNQALSFDSTDITFDIYELNSETNHAPFKCSFLTHDKIKAKDKRNHFKPNFDLRYIQNDQIKGLYMSELKKNILESTGNFQSKGFLARVWDKDSRYDKYYTHINMQSFLEYISLETKKLDTDQIKNYRIVYIVNCMPGFDNLADEAKTIFFELNNIKRHLSETGIQNFEKFREEIIKTDESLRNKYTVLSKRKLFCSPEDNAAQTRITNIKLKQGDECGKQIKENFNKAISKTKGSCLSILLKKKSKTELVNDIIKLKQNKNPENDYSELKKYLKKTKKEILAKYLIGLNRVNIMEDSKQGENKQDHQIVQWRNPCIPCIGNADCSDKQNTIGNTNCVKDKTRNNKCCWNLN